MDIKPPPKRRPMPRPTPQAPLPAPTELPPITQTLLAPVETPELIEAHASKKRRLSWKMKLLAIFGLLVLFVASCIGWYFFSLTPKTGAETAMRQRITIEKGETSTTIAAQLEKSGIIRNALAMRLYLELSGNKNKLQAGGYLLSTSQSVQGITEHLVSGKTDEFNVTISPGLTLKQLADKSIKGSLVQQGFSREEIEAAFQKQYDHPLLASKPADASLEGYVYPETYRFSAASGVEDLLKTTFDEFYKRIQQAGIQEKLTARGLTLHQGITMASIIQEEVSKVPDQKQVAQVFHKRLAEGIALQSDPTFIYPARQAGVEPKVDLDSPYNTYKHTGLPPGPIANFNFHALEAVVAPAEGTFLYFVADENGTTHFSLTLEEHETKVKQFCTAHCNDF